MDGINRYFEPNRLDGLSIYRTPEALYVDGTNQMLADADLGGHNIKNLADATNPDEAVNLGQMDNALTLKADTTYVNAQLALKADTTYVDAQLALKADDSTVVHKANAETITGVKQFNALPITYVNAQNPTELTNLSTVRSCIPYHDLGYVHYALPPSTGIYSSLLLAASVSYSCSPLSQVSLARRYLYGTTLLLTQRTSYSYLLIRTHQSFSYPPPTWTGPYVTAAIYNSSNQLVAQTARTHCIDQTVTSSGSRNIAIGLGVGFTVTSTDLYTVVLHFDSSGGTHSFLVSQANNGDVLSVDLQAIGSPGKYLQKGWSYNLGTTTWTPPASLSNSVTTDSRCVWIGII